MEFTDSADISFLSGRVLFSEAYPHWDFKGTFFDGTGGCGSCCLRILPDMRFASRGFTERIAGKSRIDHS